jgi:solute:Na+ symporter, SSS family
VLAYAVPPVVALFLAGMFWRRANADGAAATMLLGSLAGFALFMINVVFRWTHFHFLYAAPILTVLDIAILVTISLRNPAPADASRETAMWKIDFGRAERLRLKLVPKWQDYRWQAGALLVLTAAIVIAFR